MGNCTSVDSTVYPEGMPTVRPKLRRRMIRQGTWGAFLKKYQRKNEEQPILLIVK